MFIQTEPTPNPETLKFIPGQPVVFGAQPLALTSAEEAITRSPLARRLFAIDGVASVFLGADFITVTRSGGRDWQVLKPMLLGAIMDHFTSGEPVLSPHEEGAATEGEDEVVVQIRDLIDTRVRPMVARDGGDIVFHEFRDGVVYLNMKGSCSGCPSSTMTLKNGIENLLKHFVPEVRSVQAVA